MATSLHKSVGRIEIGTWFAVMFYGFTILQTHLYNQVPWNDPRQIRLLVFGIWLVETVHTALCIETLYRLVVTNFGAFEALDFVEWNEMLLPMVGIISSCIAHWFYTRRVWFATRRNMYITVLSGILSALQTVFAILVTFPVFYSEARGSRWSIFAGQKSTQAAVILTLAFGLLEDLLLFIVLAKHVWQTRRLGVFSPPHMSSGIQWRDQASAASTRYTRYPPSTQNAAVPVPTDHAWDTSNHFALSLLALGLFISFLALLAYAMQPRDALFLGIVTVQSKVHANSVLTYLNTRQHASSVIELQQSVSSASRSMHFSPVESNRSHQFQLSSHMNRRDSAAGVQIDIKPNTRNAGNVDIRHGEHTKQLPPLPESNHSNEFNTSLDLKINPADGIELQIRPQADRCV